MRVTAEPAPPRPTLKIHDWVKWQSYRKDRGTPPWIKIHRCLFSCAKWASLSDAEKGQLVSMWVVAADKNGELPCDPRVIRKVCQLDAEPDIHRFIALGLLVAVGCHDDAKVVPERKPVDASPASYPPAKPARPATADLSGGCYLSRKKRKLVGEQLSGFTRFWEEWGKGETRPGYPKGKAEAADAWLDLKMSPTAFEAVICAATMEAGQRPGLLAAGNTPKMAQGWLSARRFEDYAPVVKQQVKAINTPRVCGTCQSHRTKDRIRDMAGIMDCGTAPADRDAKGCDVWRLKRTAA